jgi:hypothetical protein
MHPAKRSSFLSKHPEFIKFFEPVGGSGKSFISTAVEEEKYGIIAEFQKLLGEVPGEELREGIKEILAVNPKAISLMDVCRIHELSILVNFREFIRSEREEEFQVKDKCGRNVVTLATICSSENWLKSLLTDERALPLVNEKDDLGMTALHHAVLNHRHQKLEILVDADTDLNLPVAGKSECETILRMAAEREFTRCMDVILKKTKHVHDEYNEKSFLDQLQSVSKKPVAFPKLTIHRPSTFQFFPTFQILKDRVRTVIPEVTRSDPQLIVCPTEFVLWPTVTEEEKRGLAAAESVFEQLKHSLTRLEKKHRGWSFVLFSNLKLRLRNHEEEIDFAILCFCSEMKKSSVLLIEVRSSDRERDIFHPPRGFVTEKGKEPLSRQLKCLEENVEKEMSWIQSAIAYPNFPETARRRNIDKSGNGANFTELEKGTGRIFKEVLVSHRKLDRFLSQRLMENAAERDSFAELFFVFVMLSHGVLVIRTDDKIDKETMALLSPDQVSILNEKKKIRPEDEKKKPVLIVGGAGTGKTFLVLMKLQKLKEQGRLNEYHRAVIAISQKSTAFTAWMQYELHKRKLRDLVDLCHIDGSTLRAFQSSLESILQEHDSAKFIFFDQIEDYLGELLNFKEAVDSIKLLSETKDFVWLLLNHEDLNAVSEEHLKSSYLWQQTSIHVLTSRIRNSRKIGSIISIGVEGVPESNPDLIPKPDGDPSFLHSVYYSVSRSSSQMAETIARIVLSLFRDYEIEFQNLLIIRSPDWTVRQLRIELEKLMLPVEFHQQKKVPINRAPLIIPLPVFESDDRPLSKNFEDELNGRLGEICAINSYLSVAYQKMQDFLVWLKEEQHCFTNFNSQTQKSIAVLIDLAEDGLAKLASSQRHK